MIVTTVCTVGLKYLREAKYIFEKNRTLNIYKNRLCSFFYGTVKKMYVHIVGVVSLDQLCWQMWRLLISRLINKEDIIDILVSQTVQYYIFILESFFKH